MPRLARRILALLFGFILFVTCSTLATRAPAPPRRYEIYSASWENATVEFLCQGSRWKIERQIGMGETRRGTIDDAGCFEISFRITLFASREALSRNVIGWGPGSTLQINVMDYLPLTSFMVR